MRQDRHNEPEEFDEKGVEILEHIYNMTFGDDILPEDYRDEETGRIASKLAQEFEMDESEFRQKVSILTKMGLVNNKQWQSLYLTKTGVDVMLQIKQERQQVELQEQLHELEEEQHDREVRLNQDLVLLTLILALYGALQPVQLSGGTKDLK